MVRSVPRLAAIVFALVMPLGGARASTSGGLELPVPTKEQHLEYIHRARVWEATDVADKDLYRGPTGRLPYGIGDEVGCEFVPTPMNGWSEKFACRLDDGTVVKVKYEAGGKYKEVFGEVLGTRLFWALGFYADRMIPAHVTCRGCPEQPWKYVRAGKHMRLDDEGNIARFPDSARLGTYRFDLAAIEEPIDSETIRRKKKGWSWSALGEVEEAKGGASKAEIDALKLLNAFVQNGDNKARQNALACPTDALEVDDAGRTVCRRPIMYVSDLGAVFGNGGFTTGNAGRTDFEGWSRRRVWRDEKSCRARLAAVGGIFRSSTLRDPKIGEEGRALLSAQLSKLSDAQIADLFRASHIEALHQTTGDGEAGEREVTIDDWVELFKQKRSEITGHPGCRPQ